MSAGAVPYVAPHSCEWSWDDYCWETACGNAFVFENDGPTENQAKFCQYCGGNLIQMPYADDPPEAPEDQFPVGASVKDNTGCDV